MIDGVMVFFLSLMWIESLMHFEWKISLHNIVIVLYLLFLYVKRKKKVKGNKNSLYPDTEVFPKQVFFLHSWTRTANTLNAPKKMEIR